VCAMILDKFHKTHLEETTIYVQENAESHAKLRGRNKFFRDQVNRVIGSQIQSQSSVLDLGCGDVEPSGI